MVSPRVYKLIVRSQQVVSNKLFPIRLQRKHRRAGTRMCRAIVNISQESFRGSLLNTVPTYNLLLCFGFEKELGLPPTFMTLWTSIKSCLDVNLMSCKPFLKNRSLKIWYVRFLISILNIIRTFDEHRCG